METKIYKYKFPKTTYAKAAIIELCTACRRQYNAEAGKMRMDIQRIGDGKKCADCGAGVVK